MNPVQNRCACVYVSVYTPKVWDRRLMWKLAIEAQTSGVSILEDNNQGRTEARVQKTGED